MPNSSVTPQGVAVEYIRRTRDYYRALGYEQDYNWATNDQIPFAQPGLPLSDMRVGLVTTASPQGFTKQSLAQVWSAPSTEVPQSMFTDNLAWDKETTHTRDTGSFLPLASLHTLVGKGQLGSVAPRYYGVPSEYSQRQTLANDAPEILRLVQQDRVDAVLLVPL